MTATKHADVEELGPMSPPPWPSHDGRPMVEVGLGEAIHRVGAPSWAGARATACGRRGSFMETDARLPRCAVCWGGR